MQKGKIQTCLICLQQVSDLITIPQCQHSFCRICMKGYIDSLKKYNLLRPEKLICMSDNCNYQLSDTLIQNLYPGQQGFIFSIVRKRYQQSKDPSIKIFNCKGFTKTNRQPLVQKPSTMGRDIHSKLMNQKVTQILQGKQNVQDKKICTNILSFNKLNSKQKTLQCYVCGVSYCTLCQNFMHQGKCQLINPDHQLTKYTKKKQPANFTRQTTNIEAYLQANKMAKCLNPKCGLAIAKEQGCFWVKCRCSWQFCYPCRKLWGDCEHFSKYPYKKFVPPPEWMVKALNLY